MKFKQKIAALLNKAAGSPEKKRLVDNFLSLSFLQFANYLLPLIVLPYLTRVLGPEKYGLIAFAQAFMFYLQVVTDYGFMVTATRDIAFHRSDPEKVSRIFSAVMMVKMALTLLGLVILLVVVFSIPKFYQDWELYLLSFGMVIGHVIFPVWFYQGMERMRYITLLTVLAKLIFTLSIFVFVHKTSDYLLVPLLNSVGYIVSGVIGVAIAVRRFGVKFTYPGFSHIKEQVKDGWHIFLQGLSGNLYGQGTVFILGLLASKEIVGYYSVAEKLVKSITGLSQPVAQAILPYVSHKVKDIKAFKRFLKTTAKNMLYFGVLASLATFILSGPVYTLISGYTDPAGILSFRILAGMIALTMMNTALYPFLIALKVDKNMFRLYFLVGINFLWICFFLTTYFTYIGTAISLILVEAAVLIGSVAMLKKYLGKRNGENSSRVL